MGTFERSRHEVGHRNSSPLRQPNLMSPQLTPLAGRPSIAVTCWAWRKHSCWRKKRAHVRSTQHASPLPLRCLWNMTAQIHHHFTSEIQRVRYLAAAGTWRKELVLEAPDEPRTAVIWRFPHITTTNRSN